MGQITICDCCKVQQDENKKLYEIIVEQVGKKKDKKYTVCLTCRNEIDNRLKAKVAPQRQVEANFVRQPSPRRIANTAGRVVEDNTPAKPLSEADSRADKIKALEGGASVPGGSRPAAPSRAAASNNTEESSIFETEGSKSEKKCIHMNKSRIKGVEEDNPYQTCRDCGAKLPFKNKTNPDSVIAEGV